MMNTTGEGLHIIIPEILGPNITTLLQNHYEGIYDDIFHASYDHSNGTLLRETSKKLSIKLTREPKPCFGFSLAKSLWKPIPSSPHSRAIVKLESIFMDLSGPKPVAFNRGNS